MHSFGCHWMLAVMISVHLLFDAWKLMPISARLFHSLSTAFHRSLIREHPERAKALPFLRPPIPSGSPFVLRIDGLPKRGYLRVSAALVGSALVRPGLTFNQAPTMLFHIE